MKNLIILILFLLAFHSCSKLETPKKPHAPKKFPAKEVILAHEVLGLIYATKLTPLECVPDRDEASFLLRTLKPRMEEVEDDHQALLDSSDSVKKLVDQCLKDCTCLYLDELFRENSIILPKDVQADLLGKVRSKELGQCLVAYRNSFCERELFKTLDDEKSDFSFDDSSP